MHLTIWTFYECIKYSLVGQANKGRDSSDVDTSLPLTAVNFWIMNAQYFALII